MKREVRLRDILGVFWAHIRPYKWKVFFVIFFICVGEGLNITVPWFYKRFFDVLVSAASVQNGDAFAVALWTFAIVTTLHLLLFVTNRIAVFLTIPLEASIMRNLEQSSFKHLMGLSYGFFTSRFAGSLVQRLRRLSRSFGDLVDIFYWNILTGTITLVGALTVIWFRSPNIALAIIAWLVVFSIVNYLVARWKIKYDAKKAEADSHVTAVLADAVTNSTNVKLFSGSDIEEGRFNEATEQFTKLRIFTWRIGDINDSIQWFFMIVVELVMMYLALRYWQQGLLTIGDFALFQAYLLMITGKTRDIGRVFRRSYEALADAKEMVEILKTPRDVKDARSAKDLRVTRGEITCKNVSFFYRKNRPVLQGLNISIKPGEKVALIGPSGAGKSTIVKLLFRFFDIQKGKILIDRQDIAKVTQDSLRSAISLVPQEPILFHRTLMENIRYGRRDATNEEVMEAAKKARCHEFITGFPEGYETYVGERGVKLSGGERQRVAIARAILKNAPILVLDEATASLDSESELLIQEALEELMQGKTTIVIAHRLSTIMKMDRVIVIDNGKVVDEGSHKQLVKKIGIYKKLWEIQAGGFSGE